MPVFENEIQKYLWTRVSQPEIQGTVFGTISHKIDLSTVSNALLVEGQTRLKLLNVWEFCQLHE